MAIPEGYVSLGFVGFTDRGDYNADAVYNQNDLVHRDNAIWKCLMDGTTGIAPDSGSSNWSVYIQSQTKMSGIMATDTFGVSGDTGEVVVAQTFLDSLAEKVVNQMLTKSGLVNSALATVPGVAALDSVMGKTLMDAIDQTNSNLDDRTAVADLFEIADNGASSRCIVRYDGNTLNTPYKAGITHGVSTGLAIISVHSENNWGIILCLPNGGVRTTLYVCKKTDGVWGNWESLALNRPNNELIIFGNLGQVKAVTGVTNIPDLKSLFKAMPNNSMFVGRGDYVGFEASQLADVNGKAPSVGILEIIKDAGYRNLIRLTRCSAQWEGANCIYITRYIESKDIIAPWIQITGQSM